MAAPRGAVAGEHALERADGGARGEVMTNRLSMKISWCNPSRRGGRD
jgi:hypothetical protein